MLDLVNSQSDGIAANHSHEGFTQRSEGMSETPGRSLANREF